VCAALQADDPSLMRYLGMSTGLLPPVLMCLAIVVADRDGEQLQVGSSMASAANKVVSSVGTSASNTAATMTKTGVSLGTSTESKLGSATEHSEALNIGTNVAKHRKGSVTHRAAAAGHWPRDLHGHHRHHMYEQDARNSFSSPDLESQVGKLESQLAAAATRQAVTGEPADTEALEAKIQAVRRQLKAAQSRQFLQQAPHYQSSHHQQHLHNHYVHHQAPRGASDSEDRSWDHAGGDSDAIAEDEGFTPAQHSPFLFGRIDTNGDGFIDGTELNDAVESGIITASQHRGQPPVSY